MLEEIVHIRNFIFSEKIQLMAIREGERTRDTANVKSCRDICGLYRVLYIFFLLRLKLVKQCRFCPISQDFICSNVIYEYPNILQGEFCELIGTKRQL